MNIEELNSCFDTVTPTKEQKERMFEAVMRAKEQPVKVVKFNSYKYLSAAAAVIAFGVFVAVYSNTGKGFIEHGAFTPEIAVEDSSVKKTDGLQETVDEKNAETNKDMSSNSENESFSNLLMEQYPQLTDTKKRENTKTAINDNSLYTEGTKTENVKSAKFGTNEPETEKTECVPETTAPAVSVSEEIAEDSHALNDEDLYSPRIAVEDNKVDSAVSSGGGGSSSGSSVVVSRKGLSLSEITSDTVYSDLFPAIFVRDFTFTGAYETEKIMEAHFETKDGRYMSVAVVEDGKYDVYQQIVTPSQILGMSADGYIEFAVKCENYYVIYYVETNSTSEVYEMVTSSAYFK